MRTPSTSLADKAGRGAAWTMAGYAIGQVMRFVSTVVMTRLLYREAFGLMAIVGTLLQGFQLFTDIGIGPNIVQSKRGLEPTFLRTAWTLQIGRGVLLSLAAMASAGPIAAIYNQPELALLLPAIGATAIIGGLASTKIYVASRHLDYRRLAFLELATQAAAILVTIVWALISPTVWAFTAGALTAAGVRTGLSHLLLRGPRDRIGWFRSEAWELLTFGRWMFFSSALTFLCMHADRLLLGKMIPMALLGVYSVALSIVQLPSQVVGQIAFQVAFPVMSRAANSGRHLTSTLTAIRSPILRLAGWALAGMIAGGQTIVRMVYDERYADAGWIVQLLAVAAWFAAMEATNGVGLLALGRAKLVAAANATKLACIVAFVPFGFHVGGLLGAITGYACADGCKYIASVALSRAVGLRDQQQELQLSGQLVVASAIGWLSAEASSRAGLQVGLEALIVFVTVSLAYGRSLLAIFRRIKRGGFAGLFEGV